MRHYKLQFLVALLAISKVASGTELTPELVSDWKIPGKGISNRCLQYAFGVNFKLFQAGIESKLVCYRFKPGDRGHVVCLFELGNQSYIIENENSTAFPVWGNTELEKVRIFDSGAYELRDGEGIAWKARQARAWLRGLR